MRFIDYDKLHNAIYKKIIEYTPPILRDEYGRGYAEGLHRALYEIECQEKFTDWDNRKKLLQPERSEVAKPEDMYIVWFSKTLQNWKALVSTSALNSTFEYGDYVEATHNGDKRQTYCDVYKKQLNR